LELLPATCVFSNLRTELSSDEWHLLEDKLCKGENKVCAACGYRDYKKSLRLFVDWTYEDENHIQRLRSLIPLCQTCYDVRRISNFDDISNNLIEHLAKLNDFSLEKAEAYLEACIAKKKERSKHPWKPDVSYLKRHFGIKLQTYDIKVLDQHLKTRVKPSIFTSIWKFIVQQCWNAMSVKQVFFIAGQGDCI